MTTAARDEDDPPTLGPEADRRLALAVHAAGIGVWQSEIGSRRIDIDSNLAVMFGFPANRRSLSDTEWIGRIHAGDRDQFVATLTARRRDKQPLAAEIRVAWPDGTIRWISIHGSVVRRADGTPYGSVGVVRDITDRIAAAERAKLLLNELHHRVRNTFATVLAVANQTARSSASIDTFLPVFQSRVVALSRAHDLLAREKWSGTDLADLVVAIVRPDESAGRPQIAIDGPRHELNPAQALSLTLALHELATNARKYGALSVPAGTVSIGWRLTDTGTVALQWTERDGPPVHPPTRQGFGTRLLDEAFGHSLGGSTRLEFEPAGVTCRIEFAV